MKVQGTNEWAKYPVGTKAFASGGGHWTKIADNKWKWHCGSTFPTPGGDFAGLVEYPDHGHYTSCGELNCGACKHFTSSVECNEATGSFGEVTESCDKGFNFEALVTCSSFELPDGKCPCLVMHDRHYAYCKVEPDSTKDLRPGSGQINHSFPRPLPTCKMRRTKCIVFPPSDMDHHAN